MVKLVLFDIDGTLLRRAGPHHREALAAAVKRVTGLETTTEGIAVAGMLEIRVLALVALQALQKLAEEDGPKQSE